MKSKIMGLTVTILAVSVVLVATATATRETQAGYLLVCRLCLATFLIPPALRKLAHREDFTQGVIEYRILPETAARAVGALLPPVELVLGLCMLLGVLLPLTGALTAGLFVGTTVAVSVNLRRNRYIPCSCYGIADTETIGAGTLARGGSLLLLALVTTSLGQTVLAERDTIISWPADRAILGSVDEVVPVVLLYTFGLALVYLLEWGVDVRARSTSHAREARS